MRQSCSGVWAGRNTSIDGMSGRRLTVVTFYPNSSGLVTTIIYEITELDKIGKYDPAGSKYGHHVCILTEINMCRSPRPSCVHLQRSSGVFASQIS